MKARQEKEKAGHVSFSLEIGILASSFFISGATEEHSV
jgi:hypothetical protein